MSEKIKIVLTKMLESLSLTSARKIGKGERKPEIERECIEADGCKRSLVVYKRN